MDRRGGAPAGNELAGTELLDQASAVEATSLNLSFVVGPALAGVLAGALGAAAAVEVQALMTLVAAALIAVNPAFDARPPERAARALHAMRDGLRALRRDPLLLRSGGASMLAMFGWGLASVGFPLYAARYLHAGTQGSGYLWAGLALGSAVGTVALPGPVALWRVGISYLALGLSAQLWPLGASRRPAPCSSA